MMKNLWQKSQPHVIAIAIFFVIAVFYCLPAFKGMVVNQHDVLGWKGMAQQSFEFKEKYGHFPYWTNSLFSGMPAYQVAFESKYNFGIAWLDFVFKLGLASPASLFFLSCLCFYILGNVLKMKPWVAVFAALAYSFASYNAILVAVGHTTKFSSMGYAPAVLAGFILLTQGKYRWGFITTLVFSTLLFYQNHIQIVYYTLITIAIAAIAFAIKAIKEKQFVALGKTAAYGLVAAGISAGSYAIMLIPMNEYAKETMRGGRSELTINKPKDDKTKGGLDKEYAFRWSYGIDETLTIALPELKGGSSGPGELGDQSKAISVLQESGLPQNAQQYFYQFLSSYWGPQRSGTSGPVYFGAIVVMLFLIGLFVVRSWHLGWLVAATLFGLVLAWGYHVSSINYFLFDHLPYYNKFRAPSIAMVIPQLTFSVLAGLALQALIYEDWKEGELMKRLKPAAIAVAGFALIICTMYFTSDYRSENDVEGKKMMVEALTQGQNEQARAQVTAIASDLFNGLSEDRKALFGKDLLRMLFFFVIGGGLIYATIRKKLAATTAVIILSVVSFIDLIQVDLRYLNNARYVPEDEFLSKFTPNRADMQIKQDTGYYRVFDRENDFSDDSRSAYHHNSVGGYHPAKLGLYQDLISEQIGKGNMQLFNMLNTKYFIINNPSDNIPVAITNPDNIGAAWLVKNIKYVNNADEEMRSLDSIKPLDTVYVDVREKSKITGTPQFDSTAKISFVENKNDYIKYTSVSAAPQFAVFSEIYYPYGWKAYVDGKETPIARVDYAFRGLSLPAGNHTIEFKFEPDSVKKGDLLSLILGIVSWILILICLFFEWKDAKKATV